MPVRKVHVQLRDLNGPRDGVDKSWQLRIALAAAATLVVEYRSSSAFAAIDSALNESRRVDRTPNSKKAGTHPQSNSPSRIEQTLT